MKWNRSLAGLLLAAGLCFSQQGGSWPKSDQIEAAELAKTLRAQTGKPPVILCVAFPLLYNSRHIAGAIFAGPGGQPEGLAALKAATAKLAKDSDIVIYCGCCPMDVCPNVRPAYGLLEEMGFERVRVLNIPTNMATDWYAKDYPSEAGRLSPP